jgi:hypothetical protein
MKRATPLVLLITACGACGNGGGSSVDATPVVDIDNGSCGDQLNFTGELVDFDSTTQTFCGIFNAHYEGGGGMDDTAPNGRFEMCIPRSGVTQITITPPSAASSCQNLPGTYTLGAIGVASSATILAGGFWSGRLFTMERAASLGVTLDPAKAHVIVHVDGPARAVAVSATHGPAQAFNGTAWAAGESGSDVFFPNVDVPPNNATAVSVVGGAIGAGSIPVAAGKVTLVSVMTRM